MLNQYIGLLTLLCVPADAVFQWPSSETGDTSHPWKMDEVATEHHDQASSREEWEGSPSIFWRKRKEFDKGTKEFIIDVRDKDLNIHSPMESRWQKNKGREEDLTLRLPPWYSFVFEEDVRVNITTEEHKSSESSSSSETTTITHSQAGLPENNSTLKRRPPIHLHKSISTSTTAEELKVSQDEQLPSTVTPEVHVNDSNEDPEELLEDNDYTIMRNPDNDEDPERFLFEAEELTTTTTAIEKEPSLKPNTTFNNDEQSVTPVTDLPKETTEIDEIDNLNTVTPFTMPPVEIEQNGTTDIFKWLFKVARQIIDKSSNKTANRCSHGTTALHLCTGLTGETNDQNSSEPNLQQRYSIYKCKNTIFEMEEFSLDTDRSLSSVYSDEMFPEGEYTILGESAVVCFPFSRHFLRCNKTFISLDTVQVEQNGHILWYEERGQFSAVGNFELYNRTHAVVCNPKNCKWCAWFFVTWIISALSLLMASIIFLAIPQRDQHLMQVLLCHMTSLLIFYTGLIALWFYHHPFTHSCRAIAMSIHFGFLSSFFWINIFGFTLWKQFRGLKSLKHMVPFSLRRLMIQCLYGWGLPLITVLGFYLLDLKGVPRSPKYERNCLVRPSFLQRAFFYGPIIPVLISNLVFFVLVIINLRRMSRDAKMVNRNVHLQLLKLCFKLIIVMGFWWIVEVITWGVGVQNYYLAIPRLVNGLQGFYLLIIYVCKDNILYSLRNHFCQWRKPKLRPKTFHGSCLSVAGSNGERNRLSNLSISSIT